MTALTAADSERARSWALTIAAELLRKDGEDAPFRDEGKERCWADGFHVCRQSGAWYSFGAGRGGLSALSLIRFLWPTYTREDATRWLVKFLAEHDGTGKLEAEDDDWTQARREATADIARHYLEIAEPLPEEGAEVAYLASRGLSGPYPEALRRVPNARPGESALLMPLTADGRVTGILLTYIDVLGAKSLAPPTRRRLDIERAPGALMMIQGSTPGVVDIAATMIVAEGLENAMSVAHPKVAHPGWKIVGLVGINTLKNVPAKAGERIIVFQDSDDSDHPAQIGLQAGIDSLLLQGAQVRRSERHEAGDANAILQAKGPAELKRLLSRPAGAPLKFGSEELSIDAEISSTISRVVSKPRSEWEKVRKGLADRTKWRVGTLDREYERARKKAAPEPAADDTSTADSLSRPPDEPWIGDIPPLVTILDNAYAVLRRHIWQPETGSAVAVVWVALTHLVHNDAAALQVCPKLHITSAMPDCGKTGLLEILAELAPRSELQASYTGSSIFRLVHAGKPTLLLDEADQVLADPKGALSEILNASHRRRSAYVIRSEQDEKGAWHVRRFSVWGATAFAGIGQLPPTLASRSIRLVLQRALPEQSAKLHHLEDGTSKELTDLRRQLAAWGVEQGRLARPKLPGGFHNRLGDNWRPLLAVAELAGGAWPERIRQAMEEARKMPQRPPLISRLLLAIHDVFEGTAKPRRISTGALIAKLIEDEEGGWDEANKGKPINAWWLRERLDGLLDPPGSQRWKEGAGSDRRDVCGYTARQFDDAFARYLTANLSGDSPPPTPPTYPEPENPAEMAEDAGGDKSNSAFSSHRSTPPEKAKQSAALEDETFNGIVGCVESPDNTARVSLFITQAQKRALRERGYSDEQIRKMLPVVAHRILGLIGGAREQPSTAEPEKPPGNREASPPTARSRRAKPNGPAAKSGASPRLDLPEPSPVDYSEGAIATEVCALRAANPKRSIRWIAQQSGQPPSVVREILGNGEGAP